MPSPFPGMDPYLEAHWGDIHTRLTLYACDQIQTQLPRDLRARVEEYLSVESDEKTVRQYIPDVRVVERPELSGSGGTATAVAVAEEVGVAAPFILEVVSEPRTLRSIRIVDTSSGHRIVTAIEFVSPANKTKRENRKQYREKRKDLLDGGANVVEIDLTRKGKSILAVPEYSVPAPYRTTYRACVVRATHPERYEIYRLPLEEKLPTIRIPLRPDDKDIRLDLQALIAQAWQSGSYDDIDYGVKPVPALYGRDADWAEALLRSRSAKQ